MSVLTHNALFRLFYFLNLTCLLLIYCNFLFCVFMGVCVCVGAFFFFFLFSVGFVLFWFVFYWLVWVWHWRVDCREGDEEGETVIRIYCVKKTYF